MNALSISDVDELLSDEALGLDEEPEEAPPPVPPGEQTAAQTAEERLMMTRAANKIAELLLG